MLQRVNAMLKELPWTVGAAAEKMLPPKLVEYDRHAADLRDGELWRVGSGDELPELEGIKDIKLPPVRSAADGSRK